MKSSPIVVAILFCAAGNTAIAQNTDDSTRPGISASEFVEKAGAGGLVTDHTKANEQLVTAIKGKGLEVPSSRSGMHEAMMDKLREAKAGKEFDRDYMEQMVKDHQSDIELFETAADDIKLDAQLRAYAKNTLPTLRNHLKQAQTIESKLSN